MIFSVTSLVFFLIHWVPGDPVEVMLGESASVADREALRVSLGLDQPITTQYVHYLQGLLQLDLAETPPVRNGAISAPTSPGLGIAPEPSRLVELLDGPASQWPG